MKYAIPPTLVALLMLILPSFPTAKDFSWAEVSNQVFESVVAVQRRNVEPDPHALEGIVAGVRQVDGVAIPDVLSNVCTGFVIHAAEGFALTAYHCLNEGTDKDVFVDGEPTRVVWGSRDLDAAVLSIKTRKPALGRRVAPVRRGLPVALLGYGYGLSKAIFKAGYVANLSIEAPDRGLVGLWFMLDSAIPGGMSGGPMFDEDGLVVSITQRGDNYTTIGRPIADIHAASSQYWQN